MSFLFTVEGTTVIPTTETLLIPPFQEIWGRDLSKDKEIAVKEFAFIEFMTSKKKSNPFAGFTEEERPNKVKKSVFKDMEWEPDSLIEQAMAKMVEFQKEASPTYQYYIDSLVAAEKTRKFLRSIDLSDKNEKTGNLLYKPRDVTSAIVDTEKVIQTLANLKDKVEQELFDSVKTRGNKEINPYEV